MKNIVSILIILLFNNMLYGNVKLTLDLEINESENVFFNLIIDIVADSKNNIYVLDAKEKYLYKFNEKGQFLQKIGRPGDGPGEFKFPCSVFIDSEDNIFILDIMNRRIEVFNNSGKNIKNIKISIFPKLGAISLAIDGDKNIYISGYYYDKNTVLCKYSSTGEFITAIPLPLIEYNGDNLKDFEKITANQNLAGGSLCLDKENRMYFSYRWPYKICIIEKDIKIISSFSGTDKLNWKPGIFHINKDLLVFGESTSSKKIFFINEYLINSIQCIDWEANTNVKIIDIKSNPSNILDKIYKRKRKFAVLDIFSKDGKLVTSCEIADDMVILNSDKKNRILGAKRNEDDIQSIARYKIDITGNNVK